MRAALNALTDELRRLKSAGVKTVAVSDESVAALRKGIAARKSGAATPTGDQKPETGNTPPVEESKNAAIAAPRPYEPPAPVIRAAVAPARSSELKPIPFTPPTVALPTGD